MDIYQFATALEDFLRSAEFKGPVVFIVRESLATPECKNSTFTNVTDASVVAGMLFDAAGSLWSEFGGRND